MDPLRNPYTPNAGAEPDAVVGRDDQRSNDALCEAVEITGGYPYFLQELGYVTWAVAQGGIIEPADVRDAIDAYRPSSTAPFSGFAWIARLLFNAPTCARWRS